MSNLVILARKIAAHSRKLSNDIELNHFNCSVLLISFHVTISLQSYFVKWMPVVMKLFGKDKIEYLMLTFCIRNENSERKAKWSAKSDALIYFDITEFVHLLSFKLDRPSHWNTHFKCVYFGIISRCIFIFVLAFVTSFSFRRTSSVRFLFLHQIRVFFDIDRYTLFKLTRYDLNPKLSILKSIETRVEEYDLTIKSIGSLRYTYSTYNIKHVDRSHIYELGL